MFHVGQLVVCVDDVPSEKYCVPDYVYDGNLDGLRKGCIYTVASVGVDELEGNKPVITVAEIVRPICPALKRESPYDATRFRPLDESRLTVFRQMLVRPPSPELVDEDLDARIADCERAVREALGF